MKGISTDKDLNVKQNPCKMTRDLVGLCSFPYIKYFFTTHNVFWYRFSISYLVQNSAWI